MNHMTQTQQAVAEHRKFSSAKPHLNIGCGRRFHSEWVNIDLVSDDSQVLKCDVSQGLPFADNSFAVVYHSHVLEHFAPDDGRRLIRECFRVLQPGGILRVVVPDLERIAQLYLSLQRRAWDGDEDAQAKYAWIKLELLDQLVRQQSGGMMGRYMAELGPDREHFVRSRIGAELDYCRQAKGSTQPTAKSSTQKPANRETPWREKLCRRLIRLLMGKKVMQMFDEAMFRKNGEIHRWMYDRFSLRQLCEGVGFQEFECCTATTSRIEKFASFELDASAERVFKPDSLFAECRKPSA